MGLFLLAAFLGMAGGFVNITVNPPFNHLGGLIAHMDSVMLSTPFVFVNCASISAFISDPVFNVLFYIPEGNSPLDHYLTTVS